MDYNKTIKDSIIRFLLTYSGCLLFGFIFYQFQLFDIKAPAFDYLHYGALAAIFFTLLQSVSTRNSIAVYVVLCIISQAVFPKQYEISFSLFWNVVEHILLGIAVYLYWIFPYTSKKAGALRPVIFASFIMLAWILISTALRVYTNNYSGFPYLVYYDLRFGLLFGLGLATGIEAGDILLNGNDIKIEANS